MKSIKYAWPRLLNVFMIGVLSLGSVTAFAPFLTTPVSAQTVPLVGDMMTPNAPELTSPSDGASYTPKNLPVTQTWTDEGERYIYEEYTENPTTGSPAPSKTETLTQNSRTIPAQTPEGTYWWRVKVEATLLSNESAWSSVRSFSVDDTAPTIVHDLPETVGRQIKISQRIDDAHPKEGSLTITKQDTGQQYVSPVKQVGEEAVDQVSYLLETQSDLFGDGQYLATFTARDTAGNEAVPVEVPFILDTIAPLVTIGESYEATAGGVVTIGGTVSEATRSMNVTIESIGYPVIVENGVWSADIDTTGFPAGRYDINVTAVDFAGNLGAATSTLAIGVVLGGEVVEPVTPGEELPMVPQIDLIPPLIAGMPIITAPSMTKVEQPDPEDATAEEDDPPGEYEAATSSLATFAQAADTDATDGSFWGLDWYWWLLIVGGGVSGVGWLTAIVRRSDPRA